MIFIFYFKENVYELKKNVEEHCELLCRFDLKLFSFINRYFFNNYDFEFELNLTLTFYLDFKSFLILSSFL